MNPTFVYLGTTNYLNMARVVRVQDDGDDATIVVTLDTGTDITISVAGEVSALRAWIQGNARTK